MRQGHAMPFGAQLLDEGGTRFRLWAPGAQQVTLETGSGAKRAEFSMRALEAGWFETVLAQASAGTRYAYRVGELRVPDPASRCNPDDVHQASMVVDPRAFDWRDEGWIYSRLSPHSCF